MYTTQETHRKDQRKMKPETQTDRNINEGSSQYPILTKVYLLI